MRLDAPNKHIIAVMHQVLRGNGGGYVIGRGCHELCCGLTCDVLKDNFKIREFSHNFLEVGLDEELLSVKYINRWVGYFAVNQER